MKEQTIYSYTLLFRFRWRFIGPLVQLLLLVGAIMTAPLYLPFTIREMIVSLAIVVVIPFLQYLLFRFYAYSQSQTTRLSLPLLFSPWWGTSTPLPVPLPVFRGIEGTVCCGTALFAAAIFVWLPANYGLAMLLGSVILLVPRVLALLLSFRQPGFCRVKYEARSISFLKTEG